MARNVQQFRIFLSSPGDVAEEREIVRAHVKDATKAAVDNFFGILEQRQVPPEQLDARLKEIAEHHLALVQKLHDLSRSNDEPEINKRRLRAAEAIEKGDYDLADRFLTEAFAIDRGAIERQEQFIREQQEDLDQHRLSAAASLAQQAELERTRLNYRKAAEHFADAASLVPPADRDARLGYLMQQASVLKLQGEEFGDKQALVEAIALCRLVLEEWLREESPEDWAATQNNLGIALAIPGERETGTERLELAVDAYRQARLERTRERSPYYWAQTQENLGLAYVAIAKKSRDKAVLLRGIEAIKAALEIYEEAEAAYDIGTAKDSLAGAEALLAKLRGEEK